MHRHFLLLTESPLSTLHTVLHSIRNLTDSLLHLVHTDERVHIVEYLVQRALLRNIPYDVFLLHLLRIGSTTDEGREDVFSGLHGHMGIAEGIVFCLDAILEQALQLLVCLWREVRNAILHPKVELGDVTEFLVVRRRQTEHILEAVLHRRVALQEIIKPLRQTGHNDDGIIVPLVHLDKKFVERVHLVGVFIGQQLLYVIEEQKTATGFLDVVVPLVNKTRVVYRIDHCQLGLLDNLLLVEVVAEYLCQRCLARSRLTDNDGVDRQADISNILA